MTKSPVRRTLRIW